MLCGQFAVLEVDLLPEFVHAVAANLLCTCGTVASCVWPVASCSSFSSLCMYSAAHWWSTWDLRQQAAVDEHSTNFAVCPLSIWLLLVLTRSSECIDLQ